MRSFPVASEWLQRSDVRLDLNSRALGAFPAVPGVPNSGVSAIPTAGYEHDVTLSVSCYLNPNTRFQINYITAWRSVFNPSISGDVATLALRLWWDF